MSEKGAVMVTLRNIQYVKAQTSLSKTTIYRLMSEGSFPKPIKISARRIAWRQCDIDRFIAGDFSK
jgi:prophage regulatory protein